MKALFLVVMLLVAIPAAAQDDWEEWDEWDRSDRWSEEELEDLGAFTGEDCDGDGDLCASQDIGNIRYNSDGSTSQRVGDDTYHSDGTVCTLVGNVTYCN